MIILGINGWHTQSHDASACIIKNGKILAMAEEERFIRQKHAFDKIPINAIGYCIKEARITPNDINIVAFGWDYKYMYNVRQKKFNYTNNEILDTIFPTKIFSYNKKPKLVIVPHHIAHASSAFFTSGLKRAAILVIDGQGENSSTSIAYGHNRKIKILKSFPVKDSLGYFYEAINKYIGFHCFDSGKTMGLAPYGKPIFNFTNIKLKKNGYTIQLSEKTIKKSHSLDRQQEITKLWFDKIKDIISKPNNIEYKFNTTQNKINYNFKISQNYKNLAASTQTTLEKIVNHLTNISVALTKCNNVCISGGVGLNCTANGKLLHNPLIKNLYIFPAANDAGTSAGAALYASALYDKNAKFSKLKNAYLGPKFNKNYIKNLLKEKKIKYKILTNPQQEIARLLANNKIIGWFQGRMEIGPRALGNRSILANPKPKNMWKKINKLKEREMWRPLAPSIIQEHINDYLDDAKLSPFMLKSFQVNKNKRLIIPAVVHIDHSTRPQTVSQKTNKKLWGLINEFYKITNIPLILNTSFNDRNEPIVCSPSDAIKTFFSTPLDYLVLENCLIEK